MPLPRLYLNHISAFDWLIALEFGRVDDGQPSEHWEGVSEQFGYLRASATGPIVGFKIVDYSAFDPHDADVADIWTKAHFEVPLLGLPHGSAGEIILATRALLGDRETVNRSYFSAAIDAADDPHKALDLWLACLQAGDCMAHFALGYTLYELGRHHEAYRHLRYYTEVAPSGAWNWCWRGKAAEAIGETDEARTSYLRARLNSRTTRSRPTPSSSWPRLRAASVPTERERLLVAQRLVGAGRAGVAYFFFWRNQRLRSLGLAGTFPTPGILNSVPRG